MRLKPAILDPQGKAVQKALSQLGFTEVKSVRVGKLIELEIDDNQAKDIHQRVEELSRRLLANPLMETFTVEFTDNSVSEQPSSSGENLE